MKDYYQILGVPEGADLAQIRERYRLLVASCHPDKFQDPAQKLQANERVKEINEAYHVLRDPVRRAQYDRKRGAISSRQRIQVKVGRSRAPYAPPVRDVRAATPVTPLSETPTAPPQHLHRSFLASSGDLVRIWLDQRANVLLLDEGNYLRYRSGSGFRYLGGYARISPVELSVPYPGNWHLVIDMGGGPGDLRVRAELIRLGGWY